MTTLNLAGHAHLPDGSVVTATKAITVGPAPTAHPTMFGVDPSESTVADHAQDIAWFPGARIGASYGSPGEGVPAWSSPMVADMVRAGMEITFSAKDLAPAAFVAQWDTMPDDDGRLWWYTIISECNRPSGGPTAAAWRSAFSALVAAKANHKNKARIKLGAVFSWWPAQIAGNEGTPWRSFITGLPGVEWIGWDQYYANGIGVYSDPTKFTDLPYASGQEFGVPVHIREVGVAGSQTDATAAAFVSAVVPVYRARKIRSVAYFNYTQGVSSARITPTGRPLTYTAWKAACANQ